MSLFDDAFSFVPRLGSGERDTRDFSSDHSVHAERVEAWTKIFLISVYRFNTAPQSWHVANFGSAFMAFVAFATASDGSLNRTRVS